MNKARRGAAVAVIILLVMAVTGMGLLSIRQGQESVVHGIVNTDSQRALQAADACAAGAVKSLPMLLDAYLMWMRNSPGLAPELVPEQFDSDFFGPTPYGETPRNADCVVQLVEIADDAPTPGYSEGAGCFKRITLLATAILSRPGTACSFDSDCALGICVDGVCGSSDVTQNRPSTVREVIVRGLFGPVSCN